MRVLILGGGFLGAAVAGLFADDGHEVARQESWHGVLPVRVPDVVVDGLGVEGGCGGTAERLADAAQAFRQLAKRIVVLQSASAAAASPLAGAAQRWSGAVVTTIQLPVIYGPGDLRRSLYPLWRRMRDQRPVIVLPADIAHHRTPRAYVDNAAAAITLAARAARAGGRCYHLADDTIFTEWEWAWQVGRAMGWTGRVLALGGRAGAPAAQPDFGLLWRELGQRPAGSARGGTAGYAGLGAGITAAGLGSRRRLVA